MKSAATAISALLWVSAARPPPLLSLIFFGRDRLLAVDELRRLHQGDVPRFFLRHPVGVLLAFERGGVEGALLHQLLPFRRLLDLAQDVDVVGNLVFLDAAG